MRLSNIAWSVAVALAVTAPAHAVTIVKSFTAPPGPYNLGNPTGTLAAIQVSKVNTYDFTFTTTGKFDVLLQAQASKVAAFDPQLLAFTLYRGTPGSGVFVANSGPLQLGPAIDLILNAGAYYLELKPTDIVRNEELVSGALTVSAVPEPASWAMMIGGLGLLGLAARRRRALQSA
jgi:hypothetical protein